MFRGVWMGRLGSEVSERRERADDGRTVGSLQVFRTAVIEETIDRITDLVRKEGQRSSCEVSEDAPSACSSARRS